MAAVPCPSCGQKMNDAVAVCPHCGKRRPDVATGIANTKLTAAEVSALLATDTRHDAAPSQGLLPTLLFPHARTTGLARTVEIGLTIACLPMVLAGAAVLAFERRRRRSAFDETTGEAAPVLAMAAIGSISLGSLLLYVTSTTNTLLILGAEIAGLIARAVIRSRASDARSRALTRIEAAPRDAGVTDEG